MTREISRRLVNGVWVTDVADEGGNGGSQTVLFSSKTLVAADLLDLHNTAVELLPAPAGRHYYAPLAFILHYRFGTTPYNENVQNDLTIGFGSSVDDVTGPGNLNTPLGFSLQLGALFTRESDTYGLPPVSFAPGFAFVYWWPADVIEGKAISIAIGTGNSLTGGDGSLTVRTFYSLIDGAPS